MDDKPLIIDDRLARRLISSQFPKWKDLPIYPVKFSGWDNRTFHLGEHMLVRMPSAEEYSLQVEKEQLWLPKLAPLLPLPIPEPLAKGEPALGYPWKWSIYRFLEGDTAASAPIDDLSIFAAHLANFLIALQSIDSAGGPSPGPHSFYRGGSLMTYDAETREAIFTLRDKIDVDAAIKVWEEALKTSWQSPPVWVHGDISASNLLVQEGRLSAVIDFGQLTLGDPACDLSIAWTLFKGESRKVFRDTLPLDAGTWTRARAWTLWKALITAVKNQETAKHLNIIEDVLTDKIYV